MALVSGGRSRLNPNAPLYIPAVVRQVEDFTPEWYDLISTSTWYRDYWLSQHQEATSTLHSHKVDKLDDNDIVDMLPDDIDFGIEEDMSTYVGSNFTYGHHQANSSIFTENGASKNVGVSKAVFPPGSKFAAQPVDNVQGWMRV